MLKSLSIKNIGLISSLSVEFGEGLNILTGETGAGKSMILSALNLLLGERADLDTMSDGADSSSAESLFDAKNHQSAASIFDEDGILPEEGEFVIRRVLQKGGKSRAFVNGSKISLATLKSAGETMVDIHGQHQHQALLNKETHLPWLDYYLGLEAQSGEVTTALKALRRQERELKELIQKQNERQAQKEFLEYKIEEIEKADIKSDEESTLETEQNKLAHAESIRKTGAGIFEKIYEADASIISEIESAGRELSTLKEIDPFFAKYSATFNDISARLSDAAMEIQSFCSAVEDDPARLEAIEQRQSELENLKRKYNCDLDGLLEVLKTARNELDAIETAGEDREELERLIGDSRKNLLDKAKILHKKRLKGVEEFTKEVQKELADLNMPSARFEIELILTEDTENGLRLDGKSAPLKIYGHGFGEFQFLISANEGQKPRPLVKIASGGEISRVMLALKKATGKRQPIPVLVFDEIDSGIGGKTADLVGEKLKELSKNCQILCITHLPQIARQADHHYVVDKTVKGKRTEVSIRKLDGNGRVEELARMGAGKNITDAARKHAKELIAG